MADGGRPHHAGDLKRSGSGTERVRNLSGDRGIGELLTGTRHVLGPGAAVPVAQLVATRRIGVPPGRNRGLDRCGFGRGRLVHDGRHDRLWLRLGLLGRGSPSRRLVDRLGGRLFRRDLLDGRLLGDRLLRRPAPRPARRRRAPRPARVRTPCRRRRRSRRSPCHRSPHASGRRRCWYPPTRSTRRPTRRPTSRTATGRVRRRRRTRR